MTSPDVPRGRPRSDSQRLRNALAASGAQYADGRTGDARAVLPRSNAHVYQPPVEPVVGGGPIGALQQVDTTSRTSTGFFLDPSAAGFTFGDASTMSYVSGSDPANPDPGEPGILVTAVGWYYASAVVDLAGTPTQVVNLRINSPEAYGEGSAYFSPGITGSQTFTADALIYFDGAFPTALIAAHVTNPGAATVASGSITVVKLS